jgi:uncharacterized protein (DUF983 family)
MVTCPYCGTKYLHQQLLRLPDCRCGACGGALEENASNWQQANQQCANMSWISGTTCSITNVIRNREFDSWKTLL